MATHTAVFAGSTLPRQTISAETMRAGLKAFFRIMDVWAVPNDKAMVLLGQPSKSTFHKWKRGDVGSASASIDLQTRISYALGIFKSLTERCGRRG
jgi:hypothetical protein